VAHLDREGTPPTVGSGGCPATEQLALYVEGALDSSQAARVEAHLLTCVDCRDVVMDTAAISATVETAGVEPAALMSAPGRVLKPAPRWRWPLVAGAAALAALVVLSVVLSSPRRAPVSVDAGLRRDLVAAVAGERIRPVDGRITGGFAYAPPPVMLRGTGSAERSPDVRIAAAQLDKLAATQATPAVLAARGVAALAIGDLDAAIQFLEDATRQAPESAAYWSDLSAAYLARARWRDIADDWPRAMAAAERAVERDATLPEARFNQALALEGLHLNAAAADAWRAYRRLDPASEWSREAEQRGGALNRRGARSERQPDATDLQTEREAIEDGLLGTWGRSSIAGDGPAAEAALLEAARRAAALAVAGDTMARDAVAMIRGAEGTGDRAKVSALAIGHAAFSRARRLYVAEEITAATDEMREANTAFARADSPYRWWSRIYGGVLQRMQGDGGAAVATIRSIPIKRLPAGYRHLRGRYHWTLALALETIGRVDAARGAFDDAAEEFARGREYENLAATAIHAAEAEWVLGNPQIAWRRARAALASIDGLPPSTRRNAVLLTSSFLALDSGLPETALGFQDALIASLEGHRTSIGRGDAYLQRARVQTRLRHFAAARADLDHAEQAAAAIRDGTLRRRFGARLRALRAEIGLGADPARAAADVGETIAYLRETRQDVDLPQLLGLHARALLALGNVEGAHAALGEAVTVLEQARHRLSDARDRMQAYQDERGAAAELVRFEIGVRGNPEAALRAAERARSSLSAAPEAARDLVLTARALSPDTAVLYFVVAGDRVLAWLITHRGAQQVADVSERRVAGLVQDVDRVVRRGGTLRDLTGAGTALFDELVAPAFRVAPNPATLVIVPDGVLADIAFGVLPDADGRPLLDRVDIVVAPSVATFLAASRRFDAAPLDDVRAIGDGHDTAASGLPRLPLANIEAEAVGRLYPRRAVFTAATATGAALLEARERVVHVAGHAIVNRQFPLYSRLLFAPDVTGEHDGTVLGTDLIGRLFDRTQVVVLASCESAGGRVVHGDGALSLARVFIDTGVAAVVASAWPVDDRAHDLLLRFHQELRASGNPSAALRIAQRAALRARPDLPVQAWGGFEVIGGRPPSHP
jgi:CHAT domain-containing protein